VTTKPQFKLRRPNAPRRKPVIIVDPNHRGGRWPNSSQSKEFEGTGISAFRPLYTVKTQCFQRVPEKPWISCPLFPLNGNSLCEAENKVLFRIHEKQKEKTMKTKQTSIFTTTKKALLMATFAIAFSVTPALQSEATAENDGLDKSSPKIAHGMYEDRGKSSPKIAHGMVPDRHYTSHPKTGYPGYPCTTCGKFHELNEKRPDNSWTDWLFRMLGY
jgi:hypothetical protein